MGASVETGQSAAWWFLDTLVVRHRMATANLPVVLEMTLPVGAAPPLHIHDSYDDSAYVLAGAMVVRTGDDLAMVGPGAWISTPRGVPHGFRVVGDRPARILTVHENDSFMALICALGMPADAMVLPAVGDGPKADEVFRVFAAHDVAVIGPSLTEDEARTFLATPP
jgi:quercetin dioxygenase-like cupin family protein